VVLPEDAPPGEIPSINLFSLWQKYRKFEMTVEGYINFHKKTSRGGREQSGCYFGMYEQVLFNLRKDFNLDEPKFA
jgi:hypothetical protein